VKLFLVAALALTPFTAGAVENISLQALFKDKAILTVDGTRRVLKAGDTSPEGVKLVSTDTQEEQATVEVEGKSEVLKLGVVISGFTAARRGSVILYPERGGHFFADGLINGVSVRFMVDTGATTIAMSSAAANRIGLDYRKLGRPGAASTASGFVRTYNLKLNTVQIGEITLHNVDAGVIEGNHPTEILLGMSFLGQLDMKRDSEKMELTHR
jgi:aspartyl protease family protein